MNSKGIRISDGENDILSVRLVDILDLIHNGEDLKWAILYSDVMPKEGEGELIISLEKKIEINEWGFEISWKDLVLLKKNQPRN